MNPLTLRVVDRYLRSLKKDDIGIRVIAKYKSKKKVKTESGDTMTVYEYSDKQIATRDKEKAEKLKKLDKSINKLVAKARKDLKSEDQETKLLALCTLLINSTYERVGNDSSAKGERSKDEKPHLGVTGWSAKNIEFKGSKATIKYVGKSSVKHERIVDDAQIVKALKDACKESPKGSIFKHKDTSVTPEKVNSYISEFGDGATAKDLRGYHSNVLMVENLKKIRSKGGKLPEDKKEREKQLKDEFKEALEETAEEIQHTPKILQDSYLIPGLEEAYKKDGTITKTLKNKKSSVTYTPAENVAINWLVNDPDSSPHDLIQELKSSKVEWLFDSVTREMVDPKKVEEALLKLAPKPIPGGDIRVYHATDSSTAKMLVKRGFIPETKPHATTEEYEYAPGRGLDRGLYVGATPRDVDGYGRAILEVTVPKKLLEVPTEQAQLGEKDPMRALRGHDGAVINHRLPADAFRLLPDKFASNVQYTYQRNT